MRSTLLQVLLFCGLAHSAAQGQVVTIPAPLPTTPPPSVSGLYPIGQYYQYSACEVIYLSSQLQQPGLITRLGFEKQGGTTTVPLDHVAVYLKHTAATDLQTGALDSTGYQRVFTGAIPNGMASGFAEADLLQPFAYNGTDNLALLVVRNGGAFERYSNARWFYQQNLTRTACRFNTDLYPFTQLTATNGLPHTRFTFGRPTATTARTAAAPSAYPNPATAWVYLPATQPVEVLVTDVLGRVVLPAVRLVPVGGQVRIAVAYLPAGNYFLQQRTPSGRIATQRFVRS